MFLEILAPAGSYESLKAAIAAGADAVYVGGNRFGARAYANNFSEEELLEAIDYVHLHGKKIYLTVNTLLKEKELEREPQQYNLTQQVTEAAIRHIKSNENSPFFLYLAHPMPHMPVYASTDFQGKSARGKYGDTVEELDWSVGQILQTLKSEGLADKPLSIDEASSFLNIPKSTLYQFTSSRKIPFQKIGKKILFFKGDLIQWVESGKKKTRKEIEEEGFGKKGGLR
jgi:excisionase family DNA binding protein